MRKLFNVRSSSREDRNSIPLNSRRSSVLAGLFFVALSVQSYGSAGDQEDSRKTAWFHAGMQNQVEGKEDIAHLCYEAALDRERLSLSEGKIKEEDSDLNFDTISDCPVSSYQDTGDIHTAEPIYNSKKDSYYTTFERSELAEDKPFEKKVFDKIAEFRRQKFMVLSSQEAKEEGVEKIIHNGDRRQILRQTVTNEAYNFNVCLEIYYGNVNNQTRLYYGSGILISDNLILTAGHNLYDPHDGGYPDRIDCFVACYKDTVLAEITVLPKLDFKNSETSVFVHPQYIEEENKNTLQKKSGNAKEEKGIFSPWDMGLIIFNTKQIHKNKDWQIKFSRPLKRSNFSDERKKNKLLKRNYSIAGYPGKDRIAYTMEGKIQLDLDQNKITYDIDTQPGQSGSGIGLFYNKTYYCAGIHTHAGGHNQAFNIGVLIDDELEEVINHYGVVCGKVQKLGFRGRFTYF